MTFIYIYAAIITLAICYFVGTWIANMVIRRQDRKAATEKKEQLNYLLSFE